MFEGFLLFKYLHLAMQLLRGKIADNSNDDCQYKKDHHCSESSSLPKLRKHIHIHYRASVVPNSILVAGNDTKAIKPGSKIRITCHAGFACIRPGIFVPL